MHPSEYGYTRPLPLHRPIPVWQQLAAGLLPGLLLFGGACLLALEHDSHSPLSRDKARLACVKQAKQQGVDTADCLYRFPIR